jgi:hypothetical protein
MPKVPNTWRCFADHPPVLVRLLARRRLNGKHVEAMATEDIAIASGIPLDRILEISKSTSWDKVSMGETERFERALLRGEDLRVNVVGVAAEQGAHD